MIEPRTFHFRAWLARSAHTEYIYREEPVWLPVSELFRIDGSLVAALHRPLGVYLATPLKPGDAIPVRITIEPIGPMKDFTEDA